MIQNTIFGILSWKYYFGDTNSSRTSDSHQKLAKNITHFTIQFRSKNLTHFTNLNLFDIENNMLQQHSQKLFWLYKFSSKHIISVWSQKKHLRSTIYWRPRTAFLKQFESKCLYTSVYLPKKIFVPETVRFYLTEVWGRLNNFLIAVRCLSLVKCFTIFHFNWNSLKLNYFSVFWYFHLWHFQTI